MTAARITNAPALRTVPSTSTMPVPAISAAYTSNTGTQPASALLSIGSNANETSPSAVGMPKTMPRSPCAHSTNTTQGVMAHRVSSSIRNDWRW